ncbi:MAG: twin-arginine translocation signal domain-containing protein [Candidatus Peregrinibacteria bacterium]|nr:twin-arginine translocation signal domain-containing protein [Candidatus Peregrinibacteria bacterium]
MNKNNAPQDHENKTNTSKPMTRRNFLGGAAALTAGLITAACGKNVQGVLNAEETHEVQDGTINPEKLDALTKKIVPPFTPILEELEITSDGKLTPQSEQTLKEKLARHFGIDINELTRKEVTPEKAMPHTSYDTESGSTTRTSRTYEGFEYHYKGLTVFSMELTRTTIEKNGKVITDAYKSYTSNTTGEKPESIAVSYFGDSYGDNVVQISHRVGDKKGNNSWLQTMIKGTPKKKQCEAVTKYRAEFLGNSKIVIDNESGQVYAGSDGGENYYRDEVSRKRTDTDLKAEKALLGEY